MTYETAAPGLQPALGHSHALLPLVTPALVQYAQLLAMPTDEVEAAIASELNSNPALERADHPICRSCGGPIAGNVCSACWGPVIASTPTPDPAFRLALRDGPDEGESPADGARELLIDFAPDERRIGEYVLGNLTSRGLLELSVREIARDLGRDEAVVARVVHELRYGSTPGYAWGSVEDCLNRQLVQLDDCDEDLRRLALRIVGRHLGDLAEGRLDVIARALDVGRSEADAARALIASRLLPPEGLAGAGRPAPTPSPDAIVSEDEDRLRVEVVERHRFRLRVSEGFLSALHDRRWTANGDFESASELVARARAFIDRLEGRWGTFQRITETVVSLQEQYVRRGPRYLRPLTRARVAELEGVHESTVSRATRGRYVLLPSRKLVPFGSFFDPSTAARDALRRILERGGVFRSDSDLTRALAREGFSISRRTTAKYRFELGVPALRSR